MIISISVGEKSDPDASQKRREVRDELLDWLDSSSGSGSTTPKPLQDLDPVLVLLSNKNKDDNEKKTTEDIIVLTKDKVTYEIQKEVDGLEKDIKENDRLLEWIAAEAIPEKKSEINPGQGSILQTFFRHHF